MKKLLSIMLILVLTASLLAGCKNDATSEKENKVSTDGSKTEKEDKKQEQGQSENSATSELEGEITFWHSFTQGQRLEVIQKAADKFMKDNPKVKINIETFSWNDFYTKWTTGLASGNVPDMSTGLPGQVIEMIHSDALIPLNDLVDEIGRDKFPDTALDEGRVDGNEYSIPLYSHSQVMWIRKDLMEKEGIEVPKTWDEFYDAAVKLTKDGVYGCSFPSGTNDFQATNFLNFYVKSVGESLLTEDLKANLTSDIAIEGIEFWLKVYEKCSPKDSINYNVLDQATLYYQGKTAFDFNSGFQINGVKANSPDLLEYVDAYPIPTKKGFEQKKGLTTANIPMVVWRNSKHPEVCKAFMKTLFEKDIYINFLHSVPVGMLPSIQGIAEEAEYKNHPIIQQFQHVEKVIGEAIPEGTAIGYEHGPSIQAGILLNQHIIEKMFQDIITNGTDIREAAKKAEDELNAIIESVQ